METRLLRQSPRRVRVAVLLLVVCFVAPLAADERPKRGKRNPAQQLTPLLGHKEFATRERATTQLIQMGPAAIPALVAASRGNDGEVRKRSRLILKILREVDFQQKLQAFEESVGEDDPALHDLPGWERYRQLAGDDAAARSIFVAMLKEERELMQATQADARTLATNFYRRSTELSRDSRMFGRPLTLGTVATVLFLASDPRAPATIQTSELVWAACCRQPSFARAADAGPKRDPLVKMAEKWIARSETDGAYYALITGMRFNIAGCAARARGVLQAERNSATDCGYAALALARFGTNEDIELLEGYLDNDRLFGQARVGRELVVTQIRDIALVSLVHLTKQKPEDFGFSRLEANRESVFTISTIGFATNEERKAAITKWQTRER